MCRNIRKLRLPDGEPGEAELRDAALQFVRKITGYPKPSRANQAAFDRAVQEITTASRRLFEDLVVRAVPQHRAP